MDINIMDTHSSTLASDITLEISIINPITTYWVTLAIDLRVPFI